MSHMLDKIKRKVYNTKKIEEDKPITMEEVKEATTALLKNKSPGIDGIPAEFYQTFEYVTEWLFEILQELNEQKQLTETMCTSIVKILYKKGDRRIIGNYRSLSLACTYYKILSKIITERIKPALKQIIGTEQQCFIQGGDITGNLILVK